MLTGTKIYSIEEIKRKIKDNNYSDLGDYFSNAPNYVKKIVFSWEFCDSEFIKFLDELTDKRKDEASFEEQVAEEKKKRGRKKKIIIVSEDKNVESDQKDIKEIEFTEKKTQSEECKKEKKEKVKTKRKATSNIKKVKKEAEISDNDKINENVNHEIIPTHSVKNTLVDRVELDSITMIQYEGTKCPIHGNELKNIQVVLRYANSKKYGADMHYCDICNKFYLNRAEVDEFEDIFDEKEIDYETVIYTEGGN